MKQFRTKTVISMCLLHVPDMHVAQALCNVAKGKRPALPDAV